MKLSNLLSIVGIIIIAVTVTWAEDNLNQAESALTSAIESDNAKQIKAYITQIANFNNEKAIRILIAQANRVSNEKYESYWGILNGLASFTDQKALDALADFIINNKGKPLGRDVLFVLKSNQSPQIVKLLSYILEKGSRDQLSLALEHLSEIKSKLAITALINFLQQPACKKDNDLCESTITSLHALVGNSAGQTIESITQWWSEHQNDSEVTLFPEKEPGQGSATGTAVDTMDYVRLTTFDRLKRIPKDKIIVVTGHCKGDEKSGRFPVGRASHDFDHIEQILQRMGIPHTAIKKTELENETYKIDDKVMLLFNCNMFREHCVCPTCRAGEGVMRLNKCVGCDKHEKFSSLLSDKTIDKIRDFVIKGGYVFTEDWELEEVVERAFKIDPSRGYLKGNRAILSHTKYYPTDMNVPVLPAPGATTHPYLKGVFEAPATNESSSKSEPESNETTSIKRKELRVGKGQWKIDANSPDIKIENPKEVTVLMVSPKLKANDNDSGAVAVTFGYGKGGVQPPPASTITGGSDSGYYSGSKNALKNKTGGQVLHVLSHFGKQLDENDEFVLQNLILNFLLEAADLYSLRNTPNTKK